MLRLAYEQCAQVLSSNDVTVSIQFFRAHKEEPARCGIYATHHLVPYPFSVLAVYTVIQCGGRSKMMSIIDVSSDEDDPFMGRAIPQDGLPSTMRMILAHWIIMKGGEAC